jgi:hypothetical protein
MEKIYKLVNVFFLEFYWIWPNGIGNMVFGNLVLIYLAMPKIINNLADKISVSAYIFIAILIRKTRIKCILIVE